MNKFSRRTLARYCVDQLLDGKAASKIAHELAAVIYESGQTIEPEFLIGDIAYELENRKELASAKLTTAHEPSQAILSEIEKELKQVTGAKEILLETSLDESLIGGIRLETASRVWDYSVARRLSQLKESFDA